MLRGLGRITDFSIGGINRDYITVKTYVGNHEDKWAVDRVQLVSIAK